MSYIIGITPAVFELAKAGGAEEGWGVAGLAKKLGYGITTGVKFFQIDWETLAEYREPNAIEEVAKLIEKLGIEWAIHGEIITYYLSLDDIDGASVPGWRTDHLRLHSHLDLLFEKFVLEEREEFMPYYFLIHASRELMVGYEILKERPLRMALTPKGERSWISFFENLKPEELKEELLDWFKKEVVEYLIFHESAIARPTEYLNQIKIDVLVKEIKENRNVWEGIKDLFTEEERKVIEEFLKNEKENPILALQVKRIFEERIELIEKEVKIRFPQIEKKFYDEIFNLWKELPKLGKEPGGISSEEVAFAIILKYLELANKYIPSKEPLWKIFLPNYSSLNEYLREVLKNPEAKFFDKEKGALLPPLLNSLAASRYIIGHFEAPPPQDYLAEMLSYIRTLKLPEDKRKEFEEFVKKTAFEKLLILNEKIEKKKNKKIKRAYDNFFFVIETPEAKTPFEGLRRICKLDHVLLLVKGLNEYFRLRTNSTKKVFMACIDVEHLLSNNLDPEVEIKNAIEVSKKVGENLIENYLLVYHVTSPKPYGGTTHMPIELGSDEQLKVYKYSFLLRKNGFGKKNTVFLVFERGGGKLPYQFLKTSIQSLRKIVEYLEKDVPPENLPNEFFGIKEGEVAIERQLTIIRQHALDPLKGLLKIPEEQWTFLGAAAKGAGKLEEWRKEELK